MQKQTWTIGRKVYEATHVINKDVFRGNSDRICPAGTQVYLAASRKEADGWKVFVMPPTGGAFVTEWENLNKI